MKILARYLTNAFLKNVVVAILALSTLFFFQSLLGELFNAEFPVNRILFHEFLGIPAMLVQMIPPSILLATVLTLSGFNRTLELTAFYSIGIGLRQILGILLSLVFMVCCFSLVLQDRILPPVFKKRMNYYWREMKQRPDFFLDVRKDKIWYRSAGMIYNLRTFDPKTQTIYGMSIYHFDSDFNLEEVIDAEQARFSSAGWKLHKGTVTRFAKEDGFPITQPFQDKDLKISETPKDFQEIEKEVDGLRLKELYYYIQRTSQTGIDTKGYQVKFHSRISLSFIPLVMCLLAVPFSVKNQRQGGIAKDLGICLGFTFFYWLFYSIGLSLGTNGTVPPWVGAWFPSAVFLGLAMVLLVREKA